jgi:soluble P-type ATPase
MLNRHEAPGNATKSGLIVSIPGREEIVLRFLVMDLNGTVALDGHVIAGVAERLASLRHHLELHVLTAGTHGNIAAAAQDLGVTPRLVGSAMEKRDYVRTLGVTQVVAMGNGANDRLMLQESALGIAVLGTEGLCAAALAAADVIVPDPNAGLDLLLHPARLVATLRA